MKKLTPVPTPLPDTTRCRALVLSGAGQQCRHKPCGELRQAQDGSLHPVCRKHKNARYFAPWTPHSLMSQVDAVRAYQRVILDLRHKALAKSK